MKVGYKNMSSLENAFVIDIINQMSIKSLKAWRKRSVGEEKKEKQNSFNEYPQFLVVSFRYSFRQGPSKNVTVLGLVKNLLNNVGFTFISNISLEVLGKHFSSWFQVVLVNLKWDRGVTELIVKEKLERFTSKIAVWQLSPRKEAKTKVFISVCLHLNSTPTPFSNFCSWWIL